MHSRSKVRMRKGIVWMNNRIRRIDFSKRNYLIALALMLILSVLFWRSLDFTEYTSTATKIIDLVIVLVSIIILPLILAGLKTFDSVISCMIDTIVKMFRYIKEHYKQVIVVLVSFAGTSSIIIALNWLYDHKVMQTYTNWRRVLVCISIVLIVGVLFAFRKKCYDNAHIVFSMVVMVIGIMQIFVCPAKVGVSWDDQIHYGRTIIIANALDGSLYDTDVYQVSGIPYIPFTMDKGSCVDYENTINTSYENRTPVDGELYLGVDSVGPFQVAYIPGALGIIIGRGLGLRYTSVFRLGLLFNLAFYTFIMAIGIRRIKRGKALVSFFALMPLLVFTATTYHYDMWINSLICSGYCHYMAAYQDYVHNKNAQEKDLIIAAALIFLGCIPKAVYCPLLIPLFFIPKDFLASNRRRYYITIISLTIAILAIFIAPYVISSSWLVGDQRWGGDVNAGSQISFILRNPLEYLLIMWNFIKLYVDPNSFSTSVNCFGYLGFGHFTGIWWSILIVLAFIDRDDKHNKDVLVRLIGIFMVVGALVLVITALYVSISEVGSPEVRGVQARYIFPLLIPFFWFAVRPKAQGVSYNKMAIFCFVFSTFIYMSMVYEKFLLPY